MGSWVWFRLTAGLGRWLPRPLRYGYARALACIVAFLKPELRRHVECNLAIMRKEKPNLRPVRSAEVFENFGVTLADFLCTPVSSLTYHDDTPQDLLHQLRQERGVFLITAHLGHWELGAEIIARFGLRTSVVYAPHPDPRLDRFFMSCRSAHMEWIPIGPGGAKRTIRALREGRAIATAAERLFGDAGIAVTLFGKPTLISRGPFAIAVHWRIPIYPGFVIRVANGHYRGRLYPPLSQRGSEETDVQALAQSFASLLEETIARHPDQWYRFDEVWKLLR